MRCSHRSTRSSASTLALALLAGAASLAASGRAPVVSAAEQVVRTAIEDVVRARMGGGVHVTVTDLRLSTRVAVSDLAAVPEPAARTGRASIFTLVAGTGTQSRPIGSVVATVAVEGRHVRAARALPRGAVLEDADLDVADGTIAGAPFRTLPGREALAGSRLVRDVGPGDALLDGVVKPEPWVRSGDEVVTRVRVGGLEATGRAVASQQGGRGDVIRLVNPESRRPLKGRVIGRGEVEVIHES